MTERVDFSHGEGIFNPFEFGWPVTFVGLGSIGSTTLWALAKMGVMDLRGYDHDVVESHNLTNQLPFAQPHVGMRKAEALRCFFRANPVDGRQTLTVHQRRLEPGDRDEPLGVVVSAVDSMASRRIIWDWVRKNASDVPLFIDGRIGARLAQLFTIDPQDPDDIEPGEPSDSELYESWLFSDEEAVDDPCGERTFIGSVLVLAGHIADQLATFSREGVRPRPRFFEENLRSKTLTHIAR